jgi:iron complex outermembrane receptor protein
LCSPFTRQASGNLNPPNNFLDNLGSIETNGVDLKIDWKGQEKSWGSLSVGLQATRTLKFEAVDTDGIVSQRAEGIEVSDSAIPKLQANAQIGWAKGNWDVAFLTRYIGAVKEYCSNALVTPVPGCDNAQDAFNTLDATLYNDVALSWGTAFNVDGLKLGLNVNNVFGEDAPICYSCSLNGYDAGTYDLPGTFWAVTLKYGF